MWGVARRLFGLVSGFRGLLLVVVAMPLLGSVAAVGVPWLAARVLDDLVSGRRGSAVWGIYLLAAITVGLYGVSVIRSYYTVKLAFLGAHRLRVDVTRAVLGQAAPPDVGGLGMRISQDAGEAGAVLAVLPNLLVYGLTVALTPVAMLLLSPVLTAAVLPLLVLVGYLVARSARSTYPATRLLRRHRDRVARGLLDALSDLESTKATRRDAVAQDDLWRRLTDHASARQALARVEGRFVPAISTAPLALQAVVLVAGAVLVARHQIGTGTLVGFVGLTALFLAPAQGLVAGIARVQKARVSAERSFQLVESRPNTVDTVDTVDAVDAGDTAAGWRETTTAPALRIDTYPAGAPVLHVRPGEKVAIIGASGTGKSRLAAALAGQPGANGHRCHASVDGASWTPTEQRGIRLLTHDRWYFGGTLRENVTLGRAGITDRQVAAALRACGCTSFLDRRGLTLDSVLDEHAAGLSGGERTRLALARTIVGTPGCVVLDAPLSGVDPLRAREVGATVLSALPTTTLVWFDAHPVTPPGFDRVLTMDRFDTDTGAHPVAPAPPPPPGPPVTATDQAGAVDRPTSGESGEADRPDVTGEFGHAGDRALRATDAQGNLTPIGLARRCFGRPVLWLVVLAGLEILGVTAVPWLLRVALETALADGGSTRFAILVGAAVVTLLVLVLTRAARTVSGARLEERIGRLLTMTVVERVHRAPLRRVRSEPTGALLTVATHDTEALSKLVAQTYPAVGVNALIVVLAFVSMGIAGGRLVVPVALAFGLLTAATLRFRRRSQTRYAAARTAEARMLTVATETARGHREIRAYGVTSWFVARAARVSTELHATWLVAQRLIAGYFPSIQLAANASLVGLLALTLSAGTPPDRSVPLVAFFLMLLGLLTGPIQALAQFYDDVMSARVAGGRLNATLAVGPDILADRAEPADNGTVLPRQRRDDTVVLAATEVAVLTRPPVGEERGSPPTRSAEDEDCGEGERARVVRLPPIRLHAGEWLALVGHSGAGKTTLLRALTGLVPADSGTVVLLGGPVDTHDETALREGCAYLPQSPPSVVDGTDEDARQRSLGERQSLALRQVLDQAPRIAFLDEPLAALPEPEARLQLARIRKDHPTLAVVCVTHSPELARLADRVVDLDAAHSPQDTAPRQAERPESA